MASLPIIKSIADCTDFSLTVKPYVSQLWTSGEALARCYSDTGLVKELYLETNPLVTAFAVSLFLAPIFLIVSEVNRNFSQVDRLWSILPTIYNAHYVTWAHLNGLPTQRLDTLIAFSTVWSLRLTFNYWRKGGYSIGSEDYRW
jgi:steroid 5-alpha reductase family enzyme